jgi:hypothetical protein
MDGLMKRIQISHEIGGAVPVLIMLLLLSIEICPIFFKMMLTTGTYDYLKENQMRLAAARYGVQPACDRLEPTGKLLHFDERYHAVDAVLAAQVCQLETERELTERVHEAYRREKAEEIRENPASFMET